MHRALVLALLALPALAGGAAAEELEILDLVYENATSLGACAATSVSGSAGLSVVTDPEPSVVLTTPAIQPPTPDCLVLPA